jgi:DHA2 family multidrug resistance protein-like MFS transporter
MAICGFGFGFFQSPNNRAIIVSAPRERSGSAGAIQSTARLLGQTIGAALVALIFGFAGPSGGTGPTIAIFLAAGFSALATIASVFRLFNFVRFPRSSRRTDSTVPASRATEPPFARHTDPVQPRPD